MPSVSLLSEFRPIGAVDNNLQHPTLNPTVGSPEIRIAPANFDPGTSNGLDTNLPNPRTISNDVTGGPGAQTSDPQYSAWLYVFGQFVDHDLDLEGTGNTPINIPVPSGDPNFADNSSILLNRVIIDTTTGTIINTVAGFLDLSQVYGSDAANAASLRNADGTLKTSPGNALPIIPSAPPAVPGAGNPTDEGSFVSGDIRVTENPELTALTTVFVREHNHWVGQLKAEKPTWTGDQLYNMAKAITTAEYQNVVYSEYLPALIGPKALGQYTGYNPSVNSQVTQEFSTAAFRVGHSQVSDTQAGIDNNGNTTFSESLAQSFFNTPSQDEANDGINALLRNLSSEASQATDVYAVDGLRNLLSTDPDKMDLIAIDIQRERDLGLGTLNDTRQALGLAPYTSFDQLTSDPAVRANLHATYRDINKVDLFVGGIAEDHASGADVGPTFQRIIANQFYALRAGDRFFWRNENFDPAIRQMIANTTLGIITERTTGTPVEQQNVFLTAQRHLSTVAPDDSTQPQLVIGTDDNHAQISGGPADDTIVAGLGLNQILSGGGGSNVFVFDGSGHTNSISDFNAATDKIECQTVPSDNTLNAMLTNNPATTVLLTDLNHGAVMNFNGNTIYLWGVTSSSLQASNFLVPPGSHIDLVHQTTPVS